MTVILLQLVRQLIAFAIFKMLCVVPCYFQLPVFISSVAVHVVQFHLIFCNVLTCIIDIVLALAITATTITKTNNPE
jgi:hypothetical protein